VPSNRKTPAFSAAHRVVAAAAMASNTGCTSVGELEITRRISAVAVCCSSASFVSLNNRTFSMAITAWSANVVTRPICLSVKARTSLRQIKKVPMSMPSLSIGIPTIVRKPPIR